MKKFLLFALLLSAVTAFTRAHEVDPYTIIYDDTELYSDTTRNGWDPNGTIPPQPEADYYINMGNGSSVYYRLVKVSDSPLEYQSEVPLLVGNFKIYAKEYWTNRNNSGYEQNNYIFGSATEPTGIFHSQAKDLSHPGLDLQIEGGGNWYGVVFSFYPNGQNNGGTPQLVVTGGSKDKPMMTIEGNGTATGMTSGTISFEISTYGIVKPEEQTYTVTLSYTNADGETKTLTQTVKGLTGTFGTTDDGETIADLKSDSTTEFTLTAEIKNAPYFTNPAKPDEVYAYTDLSATGTCSITTLGELYLIGNVNDNNWTPSTAIKADGLLSEWYPDFPDASNIYVWENVSLTGNMRFRFTNGQYDGWKALESSGKQYYPSSATGTSDPTQTCENILAGATYTEWYDAKETTGAINDAWKPDTSDTSENFIIYFNPVSMKAAIGWGVDTAVNNLEADTATATVDVYTLTGIRVRHDVSRSDAIAGLPAGLYIVGGVKTAVR